MEEMTFTKLLISFALVYLHSGKMKVCARPTKLQCDMFCHIKQEQHWQDMLFSKLSLVSPMMGCAYGVNLNWFLILTLEVINECNTVQEYNIEQAKDCKVKLEEFIERGKIVILKLMRTLMFIDFVNQKNLNENRFYNVLLPLYDFVAGRVPFEIFGIIPGGLIANQLLIERAESLRKFLVDTCFPKYEIFNLAQTKSEYFGDPNSIYYFYIAKLDTYIGYIYNHLSKLGFQYDITTGHISFDPTKSD
ncbi:uncharacterized protein LOC126836585 [Adelges cooleyi]|uniref:uncharacterized protein LOC126836585 n=1 Tax=Adelges cooleyi TaxID=133065 RepID=UPI00217FE15D|nr:uncharacterized protein LOC126836585 [Adelges cooleyi]